MRLLSPKIFDLFSSGSGIFSGIIGSCIVILFWLWIIFISIVGLLALPGIFINNIFELELEPMEIFLLSIFIIIISGVLLVIFSFVVDKIDKKKNY